MYHTTNRNKIRIRTLETVITFLAHCKSPFSDEREGGGGITSCKHSCQTELHHLYNIMPDHILKKYHNTVT